MEGIRYSYHHGRSLGNYDSSADAADRPIQTMRVRLRSSLLTAVALLATLALNGAGTTHIVLMHTNDLHGHLLPEDGNGGLAIIAAIVKQHHPDVLVDAGDMFTGTLLSDSFFGEPVLAVMKLMRYDLSILGNHEFDYGPAMLRTRVSQAKFPILSANVELPFKGVPPTRIIKVKGLRFGFIGLTTEETPVTTHPRNMKGLSLIHISEPTRLLSISYAVFCLKKKNK